MKRAEIKPGRPAAKLGVVAGVIMIVFGILWIGLAVSLSGEDGGMETGVIFLLVFGVMFIIAAIAITAFYAKSAYGKNRPSLIDIEEKAGEEEEAAKTEDDQAASKEGAGFCPYCGKAIQEDFAYCRSCGKKLP